MKTIMDTMDDGIEFKLPNAVDPVTVSPLTLSIFDASPDCVKLIDLNGNIVHMNSNGLCAMEIEAFSDVTGRPWPNLWPADAQERLAAALEDAVLGGEVDFEAFCPTANGASRWWSVHIAPVRDSDGTIRYLLATSRDITDRIQSENILRERDLQLQSYAADLTRELTEKEALLKQQSVLTAEIDHRVKNSFALIGSVLRLQLRSIEDEGARRALTDAANRINTLSRVHEQLHSDVGAQSVNLRPYFGKLVNDLSDMLVNTSSLSLSEVADIVVPSDVAVGLGLVMAELVSNSLKHKREDKPTEILVSLTGDPQDETRIVLRVSDTGKGLPEGFDVSRASGLGMQICRIYSDKLNGEFRADPTECGAVFSLSMPKP